MVKKQAKKLKIDCKMARVHSSDVFYTDPKMESFALFHNANVLGKNAACLLTISDSFVTKTEISAEERQNSFTDMMKLALETAIAL